MNDSESAGDLSAMVTLFTVFDVSNTPGDNFFAFCFFYDSGWFPVVGRYLTYPGNNGHELSGVCFTYHRRVVSRGCGGISPLGYLQKVNQSPTQTKPDNTHPPF